AEEHRDEVRRIEREHAAEIVGYERRLQAARSELDSRLRRARAALEKLIRESKRRDQDQEYVAVADLAPFAASWLGERGGGAEPEASESDRIAT
ncbi:MAG: hypothetical protein DIU77_018520, partial [Thermocrispum agreste]